MKLFELLKDLFPPALCLFVVGSVIGGVVFVMTYAMYRTALIVIAIDDPMERGLCWIALAIVFSVLVGRSRSVEVVVKK